MPLGLSLYNQYGLGPDYRMTLDEIDVGSIEIEKLVGVNYPKGWKLISRDSYQVKQVTPFLFPNLAENTDLESVEIAKLALNQELIGFYGYSNNYGITNLGFLVKERVA